MTWAKMSPRGCFLLFLKKTDWHFWTRLFEEVRLPPWRWLSPSDWTVLVSPRLDRYANVKGSATKMPEKLSILSLVWKLFSEDKTDLPGPIPPPPFYSIAPPLPPSLTGPRCAQPCPDGSWGSHCNQSCSCLNGATCLSHSGICVCKAGYLGPQCQHGEFFFFFSSHACPH